jgi:hypothetical protein
MPGGWRDTLHALVRSQSAGTLIEALRPLTELPGAVMLADLTTKSPQKETQVNDIGARVPVQKF